MTKKDDGKIEPVRSTLERVFEEAGLFFDELEGQSPRAAAILIVASLENQLESMIRSKFPRGTSNTKWKLIAGPGPKPFGSLEAKRNVAEVFGFYGPRTNTTIQQIAIVRNKFAHRTDIRDFDHPDVLEWCRKLEDNPAFPYTLIDSPRANDIRWNYTTMVRELIDRLGAIQRFIPEIDEIPPEPLP